MNKPERINGTPPSIFRLLTGQHSEFFRPMVFHGTRDVLFKFIREHGGRGAIKIAVVGCSAGEEVYSLLAALDQAGLRSRVELRAIDNDPQMLIRAQRAAYSFGEYGGRQNFFEGLPREYREYFVEHPTDSAFFTLVPRIKKGVHFQLADAAKSDFKTNVPRQDVVVMNNVLVHVQAEEREKIISNVINSLSPGGLLITNEDIDHPSLIPAGRAGAIRSYVLRLDSAAQYAQ